MFLERSPNSALRKVLGFSFRGISWEEDPGKFSWVVSSQENPVSGVALKAGSSQLEGARGTAGKWRFVQNIKPVGTQTVLQVRSSHLVHHGSTSVTTRRSSLSRLKVHPQRELRERVSERARASVCECVCVSE